MLARDFQIFYKNIMFTHTHKIPCKIARILAKLHISATNLENYVWKLHLVHGFSSSLRDGVETGIVQETERRMLKLAVLLPFPDFFHLRTWTKR